MALSEIQPYIMDPESEPEFEVDEQQLRPQQPLQGFTDRTSWLQNGCKFHPQNRKNSNNQHQPGSIEVTLEPEPVEDHVKDSVASSQHNEDDDLSVEEEEEEGGDKCDASSDEDWLPQTLTEEGDERMKKTSSDEDSDDSETTSHGPKIRQLCTECGSFHYSQNHICEHKTKPYVCNVCGKRCVTEFSLKLHCNIHSETYEHYCKYCYGTFKTKMDKHNHEQTHQNQSKPYKCPDCGITFASLKDRRKHMKSHKGPNEFKCDICGLTIGKKHKPRHMMIHTGAKPYKCSICERTFNQAGNLKSHMRLHTGERPYKCQYCDKAFNHNVSLKSHVQRFHPLESGDLLDKLHEGLAEVHDGNGGDSSDNVLKEEPIQKPKDTRFRPGRPRGRPKRNSAVLMEYSWCKSAGNVNDSNDGSLGFTDYYDDLTDFHQEEMEKTEQNIKHKSINQTKSRSKISSDSDYDPNGELLSYGKRGCPRKV